MLGSVGFQNLTWWNAAPVAFAPLALWGVALVLFKFWMLPAFHTQAYLSWLAAGYCVASAAHSGVPSTVDIRAGALSATIYASLAAGLWALAGR